MKLVLIVAMTLLSFVARADHWVTMCKTPEGRQYTQVGYVKPDADGFVTIKAGPITVAVYKTQVWYQRLPGDAPKAP